MRSSRSGLQLVACSTLAALLLFVVYFVDLHPTAMAARWEGYAGEPVAPEPTALGAPLHGLSERNSSIRFGNGAVVQYVNGVLRYTADGISVPSTGFPFTYRPTYNNNHEGGTAGADDGNADMEGGWNWHNGLFALVPWDSTEIRCVGLGTDCSRYDFDSGTTYLGEMGVDAKIMHDTVGQEFDLLARYKFDRHLSGYAGYSHFFAGNALADSGPSEDADFFYLGLAFTF